MSINDFVEMTIFLCLKKTARKQSLGKVDSRAASEPKNAPQFLVLEEPTPTRLIT